MMEATKRKDSKALAVLYRGSFLSHGTGHTLTPTVKTFAGLFDFHGDRDGTD